MSKNKKIIALCLASALTAGATAQPQAAEAARYGQTAKQRASSSGKAGGDSQRVDSAKKLSSNKSPKKLATTKKPAAAKASQSSVAQTRTIKARTSETLMKDSVVTAFFGSFSAAVISSVGEALNEPALLVAAAAVYVTGAAVSLWGIGRAYEAFERND